LGPLEKFERYVNLKNTQIQTQLSDVSSVGMAISTSTAVSDIQVLPADLAPAPPEELAWWNPNSIEEIAQDFDRVSPDFGRLVRAGWEAFHSATYEPERGTLLFLRELDDQFFRELAPDDAVRCSGFFKKKDAPKEDNVHRDERAKYILSKIPDKNLADLLDSTLPMLAKLHKDLNKLHKRGRLDPELARQSFIATLEWLGLWRIVATNI